MKLTDAKDKARKILNSKGFFVTDAESSYGFFDLIAEGRVGIRHIRLITEGMLHPEFRNEFLEIKHMLPFVEGSTIEIWEFCGKDEKLKIEYF